MALLKCFPGFLSEGQQHEYFGGKGAKCFNTRKNLHSTALGFRQPVVCRRGLNNCRYYAAMFLR